MALDDPLRDALQPFWLPPSWNQSPEAQMALDKYAKSIKWRLTPHPYSDGMGRGT